MRLAICYSSKNQFELTKQTFERVFSSVHAHAREVDVLWGDASTSTEAKSYFENSLGYVRVFGEQVFGGADAAIAWKLTKALNSLKAYSHIMLLENDVLLDEDWLDHTIEL